MNIQKKANFLVIFTHLLIFRFKDLHQKTENKSLRIVVQFKNTRKIFTYECYEVGDL